MTTVIYFMKLLLLLRLCSADDYVDQRPNLDGPGCSSADCSVKDKSLLQQAHRASSKLWRDDEDTSDQSGSAEHSVSDTPGYGTGDDGYTSHGSGSGDDDYSEHGPGSGDDDYSGHGSEEEVPEPRFCANASDHAVWDQFCHHWTHFIQVGVNPNAAEICCGSLPRPCRTSTACTDKATCILPSCETVDWYLETVEASSLAAFQMLGENLTLFRHCALRMVENSCGDGREDKFGNQTSLSALTDMLSQDFDRLQSTASEVAKQIRELGSHDSSEAIIEPVSHDADGAELHLSDRSSEEFTMMQRLMQRASADTQLNSSFQRTMARKGCAS